MMLRISFSVTKRSNFETKYPSVSLLWKSEVWASSSVQYFFTIGSVIIGILAAAKSGSVSRRKTSIRVFPFSLIAVSLPLRIAGVEIDHILQSFFRDHLQQVLDRIPVRINETEPLAGQNVLVGHKLEQ